MQTTIATDQGGDGGSYLTPSVKRCMMRPPPPNVTASGFEVKKLTSMYASSYTTSRFNDGAARLQNAFDKMTCTLDSGQQLTRVVPFKPIINVKNLG